MRILLLGGNGQIGHELQRSLATLGDLVITTRSGQLSDGSPCEALDLCVPGAFETLVDRVTPDVVINAAAHTAVDQAEEMPELAFRLNAEAPGEIAQACARRHVRLVHYSTDYVFDGGQAVPYDESQPAAPLGVYGASKLAGEQLVQASGADCLILRTAWIYGMRGHNFLRTMLRLGSQREEIEVVADQLGSPTPAWLVADVTARILRHGMVRPGVRHLVAAGETSWNGFAQAIFEEAFARDIIERRPSVIAISSSDYPAAARRPSHSVLDATMLCAEYGLVLPHWRAALAMTFDRA